MDTSLELNIKDFRAIKKADIALNGITVVTGINGCGKSSMSKFLYYALKYANDYEVLAAQYLNIRLRPIHTVLEIMAQEVARYSNEKEIWKDSWWVESTLAAKSSYLAAVCKVTNALFSIYEKEPEHTEVSRNRMMAILTSTLELPSTETISFSALTSELYDMLSKLFNEVERKVKERAYDLLEARLDTFFEGNGERNSLKEYGEQLVGEGTSVVPVPYYVQKVVYIDTPVIIGTDGIWPACPHWDDLEILLQIEGRESRKGITDVIKSEILHGDVVLKEDNSGHNKYIYMREDGKQFDLWECATGIKSFSILQLLIKNGFIDKHTLVILDEPEAHLHPQWVVEYARMVVMMHKMMGVKFFIASHSTDMVSAIRYIAEKERCLESLSFYLAEEDTASPYQYIYKDLKTNIEPIFDSFNKSFDKIEQYGESKGYSTEEDLL